MIKAVFMDFYGTAVLEIGPAAIEVIQRIYSTGNAESVEDVIGCWWKVFKEKQDLANGENFRTQHEVALECFQELLEHFRSGENAAELLERMELNWRTVEAFVDTPIFMEQAGLPVYFVTNSDDHYVFEAVKNNGLHPAGIYTSEQAGYSKPRQEIFLYALQKAGVSPDEVVHIGDSLDGDVACPSGLGIKSIWINREKKPVPEGVCSAGSLMGALRLLDEMKTESE